MKHNLQLPKQTIGQNQAKLFEMFIYASKIVPGDAQMNELNFEKINVCWTSHENGNTKISSEETSIARELALVILQH